MEDEDSAILLDVDGRSGVWFAFNDESGGEQHPSPNEPFLMEQLDPARDSSRYAAWTAGEGFVEWGGGIGFELKSQKSYDATRYGGFAFWARRAPGGAVRLRADVTDRNTTPYGRQCNDKTMCDRGRACDPAAMACYDNFGVAVELDEDWTFFSYRWEDLSQVGWSGNVYPEITRSAIYGIRFQSEPEGEFEFWIDDVAFVCDAR